MISKSGVRFANRPKQNNKMVSRKSIRLKGYDYASCGAYFVTVCVNNRKSVFGDVLDGKIILNDAGKMAYRVWGEIPQFYNGIDIDHFQIMPNHMHGIIIMVGAGPCARPDNEKINYCNIQSNDYHKGQPQGVAPTLSLSDIVHRFKTMTTKQYCDGVKSRNWPSFDVRLWQRNYYEHLIRDKSDFNRIRKYIIDNPLNWGNDEENINNDCCINE